jgi:hypothetical protein
LTVIQNGRNRPKTMHVAAVGDLERAVLQEVLEAAYRRQHREVWDVQTSGAPPHLTPAKRRLDALASLLTFCGSSVEAAMRSMGDHDSRTEAAR